jgi:uncharacterized protein YutE (UPF0331/DUF86 family)
MNVETAENVVLERLVPDLKSQGYDVFVHPNRQIVPPFLGAYLPDVIALRDDKNLVIEIKQGSVRAEKALEDLAKRFEGQSRCEFRIVWVNRDDDRRRLTLQSSETISSRLTEVRGLLDGGFTESALLMCWAILEAIGRRLLSDEFARPQSPARLVEILATKGLVTPDEGDALRRIADERNQVIHGELTTNIDHSVVEAFLAVLTSLAKKI